MIQGLSSKTFEEFSNYGCWCMEKKGHGPVVDEIDFACMTHTKCWGCAEAVEGDSCDGITTGYRWKFIKDKATKSAVGIKCGELKVST
jgi:hypothetical protein